MDRVLIFVFWLFAFVALVFEPLYYYGCNWELSNCQHSPFQIIQIVGKIWAIYDQWDPLFISIPLWLQIMCTIEVFLFGPLYAICAYGLQTKAQWLPAVALPFCGALFYSTIVYFAMEFLDPLPETNLFAVIVVNIPWSIFPVLLAWRVLQTDLKFKIK
jgi:hypothetical protein